MSESTDRIERQVVLEAPRSRVWRALTDVKQFSAWFGVELTAPFSVGAEISGNVTIPEYNHVTMRIWIETIQPETLFSFRWHPNAIDPAIDYSGEPKTLVSFTLEDVDGGTKLTVVESGFESIPKERRISAFTGNSGGWTEQLVNIRAYLHKA